MKRPWLAVAGLLAIYVALSLFNDPGGYLGTDTGGKVATLRAMDDRGNFDPDVGYWAEEWDPSGELHPLYFTSHVGDRWVNATTLPALLAAQPLYRVGGYRAALLVPMLGAVACALAAAALARRFGSSDGGTAAFWVVGLASPVLVYALDFWEHTLGLALMAWAVVVLLDLAARARPAWWAILAGALLGAAATMRTEALVYGLVATAVVCIGLLRRHVAFAAAVGALAAAGLAVPLLANSALERAVVGQTLRAERTQGTVAIADEVGSADRVQEAAITSVASNSTGDAPALLVGSLIVLAMVFAAVRRERRALYLAAALLAARTVDGLDFVPGFLVAAPLAGVGLAVGWRRGASTRTALLVAVLALPLVWAFQFAGGAGPQWGGRYVLLSGFLLTVIGVTSLADQTDALRRSAIVVAALVTALGFAWMVQRTHAFADVARRLDARGEPVLISRVGHLVREGGGVHDLSRWLTAVSSVDLQSAGRVANAAGFERIAVVDIEGKPVPERVGDFVATGKHSIVRLLPGARLRVTVYER